MISFKKLWRDRRGNVLAIAGAALPLVVGSAGLASDTIQWTLWKRELQRAADSAAIAGVYARVENDPDAPAATAVNTDLDRTKNNHTGISLLTAPVVTFPTGTNWTNGVRVQLAVQKRLAFSSLFLSTPPIIRADATAATVATGVYCVVSLIETGATGITATGNGDIDLGCGMITNSTSMSAAIATGSADVNATPVAAVGNVPSSDNWNGAELLPFTVKQPDPFENVNPPSFSPCQGNSNKLTWNNTGTLDRSADNGQTVCVSGMDFQKGTVNLGTNTTYILDGGNFEIGAQATVNCTHCTIILTNSDTGSSPTIGQVTINAGAEIKMSAPDSGPYDGILIYQDRRAPIGPSQVNKINGNSNSLMSGAFYFPKQQLEINGTAGLHFSCAQFVSYIVEFAGNGGVYNTCTGGYGDNDIMGRHVRLVA